MCDCFLGERLLLRGGIALGFSSSSVGESVSDKCRMLVVLVFLLELATDCNAGLLNET